ncbi:hypothetical protein P364_0120960 [Paenibacillus sp. MAEPY2]|nr:hypothetical protein P364_0120960 [Paenibacillus sp. MAEPY2]KGP89580.1 hypothetical protein P363_0101330 [Paenibacillus sp. MAEPY1]
MGLTPEREVNKCKKFKKGRSSTKRCKAKLVRQRGMQERAAPGSCALSVAVAPRWLHKANKLLY